MFRNVSIRDSIFLFQVEEYRELIEDVIIRSEDGLKMIPELYTVPSDKVRVAVSLFPRKNCERSFRPFRSIWKQLILIRR